jgi:hypothetical protein
MYKPEIKNIIYFLDVQFTLSLRSRNEIT